MEKAAQRRDKEGNILETKEERKTRQSQCNKVNKILPGKW